MQSTSNAPVVASEEPLASGVSRRSLLRAGSAAVWAVPVVQVASAAPALAVSGQCKLTINFFNVWHNSRAGSMGFKVRGIKDTGTSPSGQVTVVVHVPKTAAGAFSKSPYLSRPPGNGWTFVGKTGTGPWDFTFISASGVGPGQTLPPLYFVLK